MPLEEGSDDVAHLREHAVVVTAVGLECLLAGDLAAVEGLDALTAEPVEEDADDVESDGLFTIFISKKIREPFTFHGCKIVSFNKRDNLSPNDSP